MPGVQIKICGLSTPEHVHWAVEAGAQYLGFVFFPKSPRNVSVETAAALALEWPRAKMEHLAGLFVSRRRILDLLREPHRG